MAITLEFFVKTLFYEITKLDYYAILSSYVITIILGYGVFILTPFLDKLRIRFPETIFLYVFLLIGSFFALISVDLFLTYISIEILSLSVYGLLLVYKDSITAEATAKYLVANIFASAIFLFGISILYANVCSTNYLMLNIFAHLQISNFNNFYFVNFAINFKSFEIAVIFIIISFLIKIGTAPLHQWTIDVYDGAPIPILFILICCNKFIFFLVLIKLCLFAFFYISYVWSLLLLFSAMASLFIGSIGGFLQKKIKRLLAYSSLTHSGYILSCLGIQTATGVHAALIYLLIYVFTMTALFFFLITTYYKNQWIARSIIYVSDLRGFSSINFSKTLAFSFLFFSIAGIPPFLGFFAKFYIIFALIRVEAFFYVCIIILSSIVSAYYYMRIVKTMLFENPRYTTAPFFLYLFNLKYEKCRNNYLQNKKQVDLILFYIKDTIYTEEKYDIDEEKHTEIREHLILWFLYFFFFVKIFLLSFGIVLFPSIVSITYEMLYSVSTPSYYIVETLPFSKEMFFKKIEFYIEQQDSKNLFLSQEVFLEIASKHISNNIFSLLYDNKFLAISMPLWKKPVFVSVANHLIFYPAPSNINFFWGFGSLAGFILFIQIITGIVLAMHYVPNASLAFISIEHILRDVNYGWFFRYLHSNGASIFFFVIYCHMFRGFFFNSYFSSRIYVWFSGFLIFILSMATAFMGYVLPWGQMSLWGATVITNLFTAIPGIGEFIAQWLWGGFTVGNATLNRFFSLHFFLPFIIVGLIVLHIILLHYKGSSNPMGTHHMFYKIKFFPYFLLKDFLFFILFFIIFSFFVFKEPNFLSHSDNYIEANPLNTPSHIVPEWYFLPFYAILRSIPSKLLGVCVMLGSIFVFFLLPFLDLAKFSNFYFRPYTKILFWMLVVIVFILGWLGAQPVEIPFIKIGQIFTFLYFFFFVVGIPLVSFFENKNIFLFSKKRIE